jgi:hypothetical protein
MVFESLEIILVGGDGERLSYTVSLSNVKPDDNTYTLFCAVSIEPGVSYIARH